MNRWFVSAILGVFVGAVAGVAVAQDASLLPPSLISTKAEPGLSYGGVDELALPKTVLFSAGPEEIAADAEEWSRRGINAFFLDYCAREWSIDIWATDGKPWTIGESDGTFRQAQQANEVCRRIGSEVFLKVSFDHTFEWFNDIAWQQAYHNFRQFAIFARESGCTGMALDIEYIDEQYAFTWEGYTYDGYTRQDLVKKVGERMTRVMAILYDEFPDMVFLTFPECGFSLGQIIHLAWIEEAARRHAPGGIHYCTEHTYRNPNARDMFAYTAACHGLFHRFLSRRAWKYWMEKCSISAGIWPFGFNYQEVCDPGMSLEELRQGFAASLMVSSRYNWVYSHNCREQLIGRGLDKYEGEEDLQAYLDVIRDKAMITTPKYVALATELRTAHLRDYSADLGFTPFVSFAGPTDVPSLRLAPTPRMDAEELELGWRFAHEYLRGEPTTLQTHFQTQVHWMVIGPFPNETDFSGHFAEYPPEEGIDLSAEYDGLGGKVRWIEHNQDTDLASVDFTKIFTPTEHVCAYALCFVTSPDQRDVQIRLGTNDSGKLWLNGELIFDYPYEGTAWLDREMIEVRLPAGTSTILLKICNGQLNWGFVFRIADMQGRPMPDLRYTVCEPK
ncbi:MAG TPA: hypothetical protein PLO37_22110 [Candidatus Hydrogenedentes bacterium]|nr:hypothetical protein [Candidatus Hydrogenedentota bacterium]HPG69551.1 hypothetical protein [Candidatus Hydrogenedentota bacterium]